MKRTTIALDEYLLGRIKAKAIQRWTFSAFLIASSHRPDEKLEEECGLVYLFFLTDLFWWGTKGRSSIIDSSDMRKRCSNLPKTRR
jgi:hypothetical protein